MNSHQHQQQQQNQQHQQHQHQQQDQHSSDQHSSDQHSSQSHRKKYGPPHVKPRPYNLMLEILENQSNKKLTNEYFQDIKQWLSTLEIQSQVNPSMIDLQPEIQWFMRPFLIDFLIELHSSFNLQLSTLFLCFNLIDRYCAKRIVFKRHYQLVGCTALWIASKYEDKKSRVPTLKELSIMCRNAYDEEMFIQMEMHILSTLDWCLSHPNLEDCLQLSIQSTTTINPQITPCKYNTVKSPTISKILAITAISRFLCELSLYDKFFIGQSTSLIAITANLLACSMLQINSASTNLTDLIRDYFVEESRKQQQKKRDNDNDNHFFLTPKSFNVSKSPIMDDNDSNYTDDESIMNDPNEDDENKQPNIQGAFLGGFEPTTTFEIIKKIGIMFILQLGKITDVLLKKYEILGVIQVVKNFQERFSFIISEINESAVQNGNEQSEIEIDELMGNNKVINSIDILLQLPNINEIELSIKQQQQQHPQQYKSINGSINDLNDRNGSIIIPLTPPSATSQYSIFSNSNNTMSSINDTPISQHNQSQLQLHLQHQQQQQHGLHNSDHHPLTFTFKQHSNIPGLINHNNSLEQFNDHLVINNNSNINLNYVGGGDNDANGNANENWCSPRMKV